jgi:hypothetical protein
MNCDQRDVQDCRFSAPKSTFFVTLGHSADDQWLFQKRGPGEKSTRSQNNRPKLPVMATHKAPQSHVSGFFDGDPVRKEEDSTL